MKREEREETAKRIKHMDDYYRYQLMNKIEEETQRINQFLFSLFLLF
jgi:hypothetical protein